MDLGPINDAIGWLLAQFYAVVPNLGVAIIVLTILIMLLLYPLTSKQTRSMMAMQRVQPEIKKLQAKYKNDRQKMNEEMMKFYQENKINPLAGCLPLLVQMPILFALFSVLRNAYEYVPKSSELYAKFCHGFGGDLPDCGVQVTRGIIDRLGDALPEGVVRGDKLLHHLHFLGLDLQKAATAKHDGFFDAFPYFFLIAMLVITYVMSSRQSAKRTPAANKQMGMVMKILPPFFGLISITLPSGLVIYLFVSALFRLGQMEVIFRRHGHIRHAPIKSSVDVKSTDKTPSAAKKQAAPPPEDAVPTAPKPAATRAAQPTPTPAGRARGLRGAFALPPPPGGNGEGTDSDDRPSATSASGGGSASQRKRRNKKKRKR
jgi:YidC/Oxa1 family membrane protein insertase